MYEKTIDIFLNNLWRIRPFIDKFYSKLLSKIKSWSNSTQLTITGPSETRRLFETMADKSDDNPIKLPLIAITRNDGFEIQNISKRPLSKNGIRLDANYDKIKTLGKKSCI